MLDIEIKEIPELKLGEATLKDINIGFLSYCFEYKKELKATLITLENKFEKYWWN